MITIYSTLLFFLNLNNLFKTVFNIDNNQKCFLRSKYQHIRMISEYYVTEGWNNDADNSALITEYIEYIQIENYYFKL